jgi:hypothetical protein
MRIVKLLIFAISITFSHTLLSENVISKGVLDLSRIQLSDNQSLKLQGEIEFYWSNLFTPDQLQTKNDSIKPLMVNIPKSWSSYVVNGKKLPSNGYGTYRFWIDLKGTNSAQILSLKIPTIFSSYKLWVDNKLIAEAGTVATSKDEHKPGFLIDNIPFSFIPSGNNVDRIEIVIQVSNFSHRRAGIAWPIFIGSYNAIKDASRNLDILNLIVLGVILIIGLNHINMFLFRRKDVSNLYFGILTLVMILRNITTGDRLLGYLIPSIDWELMLKLDNFSGYGTIPFFALFIFHLYRNDFRSWIKNLMVILGIIISVIIFATPAATFGKFNLFFELYLLIGGLYLTFGVLLIATIRKRPGAFLTFLGMFILYATAINDVLSSMTIIQTAYVAPYGLVTFMLLQSFNITSKSAKAINQNEELSHQLANEKEGLERSIEERTKELQQQHNLLIEHQEKEKIQNWINTGLAKINNILSTDKSDFAVLCSNVLTSIVKYMDVKLGALYVISDDDSHTLQMVANFGASKQLSDNNRFIEMGSGLVGATYIDNQLQVLSNIPENYYKINSGLGNSAPRNMLLAPLSTDEAVVGVLELARFDEFKPEELEFIKKIAYSIASNLNTVRMNERNVNLIQQFQEQREEIQEKEEQMRENLHELEYLREQYEKLKAENDELKKKKK